MNQKLEQHDMVVKVFDSGARSSGSTYIQLLHLIFWAGAVDDRDFDQNSA